MTLQCSSFCAGESYNLLAISEFFTKQSWSHRIYGREVLHIDADLFDLAETGDVWIYSYGCIVCWGISTENEEKILKKIEDFLYKPLLNYIVDRCDYFISEEEDSSYIDTENNCIILRHKDPYVCLSFSYGLSQSIKLSAFEESAEKTIEENKSIPNMLIETGKISLSRKTLAKRIGALFLERNFVNLHSDILDVPDFFWKRPKYEQYYEMAIKFMDLTQRIQILNDRLKVIHELYHILATELQHLHSSRMEMIIIALISFEVIIGLLHFL